MPGITSFIAVGLGLLIGVPVLVLGVGGSTCTAAIVTAPVPSPSLPSPLAGRAGALPVATRSSSSSASTRWTPEQVDVAREIIATGRGRSVAGWGWVVAVATAIQESRLRNLPGGDRDSIGVFQQRPSAGWGTPAQLRSVAFQAGRFYDALLAVPNWQTLPLTVAAQAVQRSARPDAYAQWTDDAIVLVDQLGAVDSYDGQAAMLPRDGAGCFGDAAGDLPQQGTTGLPPGFTLPADTTPATRGAITWALTQVGTPYSYGGDCTAPHSSDPRKQCDCSSLVQMAWRTAGVNLPRTADAQASAGVGVPLTQVRAGDLLFSPGADGTATRPGHVVMALSNGWIIEAPRTGLPVRITKLTPERAASIVAVRRVARDALDRGSSLGAHPPAMLP